MSEEEREYKQITEEELIRIIEDHEKWLKWVDKEGERPVGMERGKRAELRKCDLREFGRILEKHNLKNAMLNRANLKGISLQRAYLEGAMLIGACLAGAVLIETHLEGAMLIGARLDGAFLIRTNLKGAKLLGAHLEGARFWGADLEKAVLLKAQMGEAQLSGAHLEEAILKGAGLEGADLEGAHLEGSVLREAHMEEANLRSAHLEEADLSGAHIEGAVLEGTNLEGAIVVGLKYGRRRKRQYRNRKYLGIRVETCFGNPGFKRFCQDEEWLENFLDTREVWWEKAWAWLWKWTSDYGRSMKQWALVSLALVFFFAFAFSSWPDWYWEKGPGWLVNQTSEIMPEFYWDTLEWCAPKFSQTAPAYQEIPLGFCSAFYFSVVTFTTLGFGDVVAANWSARLLVTIEVILGYIMLGGLISIFANKLARRS